MALNKETRQMTIKAPDGHFEVIDIPKEVKRIDGIKIGDKLSATTTEAVLVDLGADSTWHYPQKPELGRRLGKLARGATLR